LFLQKILSNFRTWMFRLNCKDFDALLFIPKSFWNETKTDPLLQLAKTDLPKQQSQAAQAATRAPALHPDILPCINSGACSLKALITPMW
jgi:hypothetical protein